MNSENNDMLAICLNDKKEIYSLPTLHEATVIDTRKRDKHCNVIRMLKLVDDYKFIGGVDRNDEIIGTYSAVRKSMEWTKKVAFHFIHKAW